MTLRKKHTSLASVFVASVIGGVAVLALYAAERIPTDYPSLRALVAAIGSVLLASVAVATIWELFQKRLFRDELLDYFRLSENLQQSGIDRVIYRFDELNWKEYFDDCTTFDFYASYARSWRGTNEIRLRELANRPGAKVRLVLPDPENSDLVRQLSIRFRKTDADVKRLIEEAITDYRSIFTSKVCQFELRTSDRPPTNAYYRFNERRVVTLYNYKEQKGDVPVFLLKKPGRLTDFFEDEFEYLFKTGKPTA